MANLEIAASRGPRDERCLAGASHPNDSNQDIGPGHVVSRHARDSLGEMERRADWVDGGGNDNS